MKVSRLPNCSLRTNTPAYASSKRGSSKPHSLPLRNLSRPVDVHSINFSSFDKRDFAVRSASVGPANSFEGGSCGASLYIIGWLTCIFSYCRMCTAQLLCSSLEQPCAEEYGSLDCIAFDASSSGEWRTNYASCSVLFCSMSKEVSAASRAYRSYEGIQSTQKWPWMRMQAPVSAQQVAQVAQMSRTSFIALASRASMLSAFAAASRSEGGTECLDSPSASIECARAYHVGFS